MLSPPSMTPDWGETTSDPENQTNYPALTTVFYAFLLYISKFQFDLETMDEEPLLGYATANSHLLFLFYLFA